MKSKAVRKWMASMCIGTVMVGSVAGCNSTKNTGEDVSLSNESETKNEVGENTEDSGKEQQGGNKPLVISSNNFSQKFSPFFASSASDANIIDLVSVGLLGSDREGAIIYKGISGETRTYNGTDYTYNTISDVTVTKNENDTTTYHIKIKEGVTFSDGEELTADDVIFSFYVYCDPTYDGSTTLGAEPIVGLKNYQANSSIAEEVGAEQVETKIAEMPESLKKAIIDTLIVPTLTSDMEVIKNTLEQGTEEEKANYTNNGELTTPSQIMANFYSLDQSFTGNEVDEDTCLQTLINQYSKEANYKALATNYAGDETYFDKDVYELAETVVIEELKQAGTGEEVSNISGIKKINEYELEVTTKGYSSTAIYQIGLSAIAPLHYYGEESQYDYENNKFGFTRGDLSGIKEKTTMPLGAGPYKFVKYENKIVYLEANETYWDGTPKTKEIQFMETTDADKVSGLVKGTIDIADPLGSKQVMDEIKGYNSNGELVGDVIETSLVDYLGYGYIGLNADTVKVGEDSHSEASKNFRKGLATIIAAYRDVSINSYYGDLASVIDYPISKSSWASPKKSDEGYTEAFSVDVNGNQIYTADMSQEQKYEKAKEAALGFFEAAGFTVENGKVTKAPEGAKLEYKIEIGADGQGDHPCFAILTASKTALNDLGITLNIEDLSNTAILWEHIDAGSQELWTASWRAALDPDMYQTYHSSNVVGKGGTDSNFYHIADETLDELILEAKTSDDQTFRKEIYKNALDVILDWAVEVPVYQKKNTIIYSVKNINTDTLLQDETPYYTWKNEVHKIEMR